MLRPDHCWRRLCRLRIAAGMVALALTAAAPGIRAEQAPPPDQPKTEAECRAYAARVANEEYLAQRNTIVRTSPFSRQPGQRDPYTDSQLRQLDIDRSGRERQIYDECVAKLGKQ